MNKILNYVKSGKGYGIAFIFAFTLIISVFTGVEIKILGNDFVPTMQNIADKLLPVKIENGVIVEPENTVKSFALEVNDQVVFPIVLDTTVDVIDTAGLQPGIYISKKSLYAVGENDTRVLNYSQDMLLPAGNYVDLFKKIATYSAFAIAIFVFFVMAITYLLIVLFCAFCSQFMTKLMKNVWAFATLMRLNSLTFIFSSLVLFVVALFGVNSSFKITIIATLLLDYIIIKSVNNDNQKPKRKHKI